jgi:hypothetical protein
MSVQAFRFECAADLKLIPDPRPTPLRKKDTSRHRFRRVPYGMWTCKDGTEVLFTRGYSPFLRRKNGVVEAVKHYWVEDIIEARHFYDNSRDLASSTHRVHRLLLAVLDLFLSGEPIPDKYGERTA